MPYLPNPYREGPLSLPSDTLDRINAEVSAKDRLLLRVVCHREGVYTFAIANLLQKLCNELRKRNITDISRENDFIAAVADLRVIIPDEGSEPSEESKRILGECIGLSNGPSSGTMPSANAPHDNGGKEREVGRDKDVKNESSNIQSTNGGKKTRITRKTNLG